MSFWSALTWSGRKDTGGGTDQPSDLIRWRSITIAADATDAGGSPTTTFRRGLAMGINSTTGLAYRYDPDATDGTQICVGYLNGAVDIAAGESAQETAALVFRGGLIKNALLFGADLRANTVMGNYCQFETEYRMAAGPHMFPRGVTRYGADHTVTSGEHGMLLLATAAVDFTLPTKVNGLSYRFMQTADAQMRIIGSSDIVAKGNAGASTLTFSTSSEKIGSHILVECCYTAASTLKWIVSNLGGTTISVS